MNIELLESHLTEVLSEVHSLLNGYDIRKKKTILNILLSLCLQYESDMKDCLQRWTDLKEYVSKVTTEDEKHRFTYLKDFIDRIAETPTDHFIQE